MSKQTINLLLLGILFSFFSCGDTNENDIQTDPHFVDKKSITSIVSQLEIPVISLRQSPTHTEKTYETKKVKNTIPIYGRNKSMESFYIVNYEGGGFIIMSADNRVAPILAYSDEGNLALGDELPGGFVEWMEDLTLHIDDIRSSEIERSGNVADEWTPRSMQRFIAGLDPNQDMVDRYPEEQYPECNTHSEQMPLTVTQWDQGVGFNDQIFWPTTALPFFPYCQRYSNGKPPAGCVAVAMGQIMKYNRHPNSYNWDKMPNHRFGSTEIARLMKDIGSATDMEYGCDGSGTDDKKALKAFKKFGYSSAALADFDIDRVILELKNKRPVYLSGAKEKNIIISFRGEGHAWVCDGYQRSYSCEYDARGKFTGTMYISTRLHMNWGWGGSPDIWIAYNEWKVKGYDYNYDKKMIYNLKP